MSKAEEMIEEVIQDGLLGNLQDLAKKYGGMEKGSTAKYMSFLFYSTDDAKKFTTAVKSKFSELKLVQTSNRVYVT